MDEEISDPDQQYPEKIESFRVDIVQTIDLERQFIFSYLRANAVLDVEDCEIIMGAGAGRKQKVAKFLDILASKGPDGYKHFVDALEIECPRLFQKITGKDARKSPNDMESVQRLSLLNGGLAEKEWIDFDRQYLSKQLENTTSDFQMLTSVHNRMVHEKNALEKKFMEATTDIESKQQQLKDLKEQLEITKAMSLPGRARSSESSQALQRYIQELMAENADKSNRIISLQESLLQAVGSAEKERMAYLELQQRHEDKLQQMRELTINYDWERRNSRKMSEKMRKQTDQIKQGEDLRREIFELKLKLSEMQDERDEAREELREFRNVTEALNAKFDSVCEQKEQAIEFQEVFSTTVYELREKEEVLQAKLQEAYLELNDKKRKNMRLVQECKTLKQQRDAMMRERELTITERNNAVKERDEALRLKKELQQSRDDAIEAQLKINQMLHDDYRQLHEEMDVVREDLRMITAENEKQRLKLREYESVNQMAPINSPKSPEGNKSNLDATEDETDGWKSPGTCKQRGSIGTPSKPFPWREQRSSTAILNSAYRRLQDETKNGPHTHRGSLPVVLDLYDTGDPLALFPERAAEKQELTAKSDARVANEPEKKNQKLSINVTAARELSRSWNSVGDAPGMNRRESGVVGQILPVITDLSMNVAMKTGSLESLLQAEKEKPSSLRHHLKSPDAKRTHPPLKSVSPKILYKVDQQANTIFDFSAQMKNKDSSNTDCKSSENARAETSNGANQDACGKQGKKNKSRKSNDKRKTTSLKYSKTIDISSIFHRNLNLRNGHRRRHSSDDVTVLVKQYGSSFSSE